MRPWAPLPDAGLHNACGALTVSIAWRHQMIANGRKQLDNRPNYNGQNTEMRSWIDEGVDGAHLVQAVQIWDETTEKIAKALKEVHGYVGTIYFGGRCHVTVRLPPRRFGCLVVLEDERRPSVTGLSEQSRGRTTAA